MREVAIRLDDAHRREFRRVLGLSLLAHVLGVGLLVLAPGLPTVSPPAAISVSLVAPPSVQAPVAPSPAPPRPKPRPPKPAPVVLPAQPTQPKPRPKPDKPVTRPEPAPEPAPERDYADVLEQLRSELDEPAPEAPPSETETAAAAPSAGVPGGRPVSPEVAAWMRKARIHIRAHWAVPANFRMLDLVTVVEVELDAAGAVGGTPRILKRSGNPFYDDNVVRGIQKASPLPAPPEAGSWTFNMLSSEGW